MGGCLSFDQSFTDRSSHHNSSANVVAPDGELRRYSLPITVSEVLQTLTSSPDSFFLCNSDRLYFDDYIPSLDVGEELEPSQIYFALPTSKLQYRLAASDMAALAVKASVAIEQINVSNRRRKTRISPAAMHEEDPQSNRTVTKHSFNYFDGKKGGKSSAGVGVSRSGSVRKLSRYSSRRAKLAVRSFKLKLTTIYEASSSFRLA